MIKRPKRRFLIGCTIWEDWGESFRVILPDGSEVTSAPEPGQSYVWKAIALGYGEDTLAMCRDHDLLHVLVAHQMGFPFSFTMANVAGGGNTRWKTQADQEERAVLSIQQLGRICQIDWLDLADKAQIHG